MTEPKPDYPKTAACSCGSLKITATAPPRFIHACACLSCQRASGSAFSYSAFFDDAAVQPSGDSKTWRRSSDSGRWQDSYFCPTCGVGVFARLQAAPGMICVPVGGFADPSFAAPGKLFWSSQKHHWLDVPDGIEPVETQ